jgi:hypothetical protein
LSGRPARRGFTRSEIAAAIAFLLALTGVFVAVAVVSTRWLVGDEADPASDLPPLALTGPEETVFDYSRDACSPSDVPDAAARAFRDARGQVHLIASHHVTRAMVGPALDTVRRECRRVMVSGYDADPARFDDREWLTSPYTIDGRTVYALVHDEYQGYNHPGRCTSAPLRCWYNAITLARSTDGGRTFTQPPSPRNLVATVPYRYEPDRPPYGLFQPSNIVHRPDDRHFYAVMQAEPFRAQRAGTCVMRTPRLDRPDAWRAWDGEGFDVRFVNPYRESGGAEHVCAPVSYPEIGKMTGSLTYNTYLDRYVLVSPSGKQLPGRRGVTWGFYYSTSEDLIHWQPRQLIREAVLTSSYRCGDANPVGYPSLLDAGSPSRNFETTGRRPWLYFTRFHYEDCRNELNRDLVRVRVRFSR